MVTPLTGRRLLVVRAGHGQLLRQLTDAGMLAGWKVLEGDSLESAVSLYQQQPCDVVLIDVSSCSEDQLQRLAEQSGVEQAPLVVLADRPAEVVQAGPGSAVLHWLPRQLIAAQPRLLGVVLHQAATLSELQRRLQARESALRDCQRQVDRLVELMTPTVETGDPVPWFTHRHMMERLYQEIARSERHGDPLTVVLGELTDSPQQPLGVLDPTKLTGWTAGQVRRHKRRCDIAGQYGPHGFMLLLPQTNVLGGEECCRRLRPLLENPAELPSGANGPLQVRFGLASYSRATASVKSLLVRAEEHLEQDRKG